jgi:ATP/maltotriose-dependent transcriptional regulator MalT
VVGAIIAVVDRDASQQLAEGWRALEAAQWADARVTFEEILAVEEDPEALDGAGFARWFLGEVEEGRALRERAFEEYARRGECDRAARVAVWVSRQYLISGRSSAASGWLARAERALDGKPDCGGRGWVVVERARRAETVSECEESARLALEIAREFDDTDLEVFALSVLGRAEVAAGRTDKGVAHLDEAMAASTAGRVQNVHTLGEAYCNLIIACTAAGDWERASEWCQYVDAFAAERKISVLFGACRTIHADVLVARGRWNEAEAALEDALDAHQRGYPAMAAPTVSALALLRVRQGRLAEAEQLLVGREEQPSSLLALAELRLAEAEPPTAVALLGRALAGVTGDVLAESRLLAPLVDAFIAAGDLAGAQEAADRLAELAAVAGRRLVGARASLAEARVAIAKGRHADARVAAGAALETFGALEMPHEIAEARLELARSLVPELPELARDEARVAFDGFKQLGAARGMDAAASLLRELGAGVGGWPRGYGELTAREREVLSLVAQGMTNARIAEVLFISEKTAGHHVSRILSKLGVRNRAEAAAQASRLGLDVESAAR